MLSSTFQFPLHTPVLPGLCVIAKKSSNKSHLSHLTDSTTNNLNSITNTSNITSSDNNNNFNLACASGSGKIMVQCPPEEKNFLNINRKIIDLAMGEVMVMGNMYGNGGGNQSSQSNLDNMDGGDLDDKDVSMTGDGQTSKSKNNNNLNSGSNNSFTIRETLVVATPTSILAYDIKNNAELFNRELSDGCCCLALKSNQNLCLVGGHCSIQGFDLSNGNEVFWSVVGDSVSCCTFVQSNKDSTSSSMVQTVTIPDFLVACEDSEIAGFRFTNEIQIMAQNQENNAEVGNLGPLSSNVQTDLAPQSIGTPIIETDVCTHLVSIQQTQYFAYALRNGTVGVYRFNTNSAKDNIGNSNNSDKWASRVWRVASKSKVRGLRVIDSTDPSVTGGRQLVVGWASGKIEIRNYLTGDILMKSEQNISLGMAGSNPGGQQQQQQSNQSSGPLAALCVGSYLPSSNEQGGSGSQSSGPGVQHIVAITTSGDVCGFLPSGGGLSKMNNARSPTQKELSSLNQLNKNKKKALANDLGGGLGMDGTGGQNEMNQSKLDEDNANYRELLDQKQELIKELQSYQAQATQIAQSGGDRLQGVIPVDTHMKVCRLVHTANLQGQINGLLLELQTSNERTIIRTSVIYAENLFENGSESRVFYFQKPESSCRIPLNCKNNTEVNLKVQSLVGLSSNSTEYHVFEKTVVVPKFASFCLVNHELEPQPHRNSMTSNMGNNIMRPNGFCKLNLSSSNSVGGAGGQTMMNVKPGKIRTWISKRFCIDPNVIENPKINDDTHILMEFRSAGSGSQNAANNNNSGVIKFKDLNSANTDSNSSMIQESLPASYFPQHLVLETHSTQASGGPSNGLTLFVYTDSLELCAEIVEDLTSFLQIKELETTCNFPKELTELGAMLQLVEGHKQTRIRLTAEIADSSNIVKSLIVKSEDYRILGVNQIKLLKRCYQELHQVNGSMCAEHSKRAGNYRELLANLKKINHMLQCAAKLRCGTAQTKLIGACRAAMKSNNYAELCNIIQNGAVH